MHTEEKNASKASKQLANKKSTKAEKSVAGSDLAEAKRYSVPNTHAFRKNGF